MRTIQNWALASIIFASAGCSSITIPNLDGGDSGTDAGRDSGTDAGNDAGTDAGNDAGNAQAAEFSACTGKTTLLKFVPGDEAKIQTAVNTLNECTTLMFAAGTYNFSNTVSIRQKGISLIGAGKGVKGQLTGTTTGTSQSTAFVFTGVQVNSNGVYATGDNFTIRGIAIIDAKADALRIENSTNVKIQQVRTEWTRANDVTNGKYGIYPVSSVNVLVEDCEAYNASDAGIYVGKTRNSIVRRNVAKQNVAGIEIENCDKSQVYENEATDNTTGLVVFDLPGNVVVGTDIKVFNNRIYANNRNNFASATGSSSTVSQVPAGTGTFVLASRRVEITGNYYERNNTVDVSVLSGLAIEPNPYAWDAGGQNFASSNIYIHENNFDGGSGLMIDNSPLDGTGLSNNRPLGQVLFALYGASSVAAGKQVPVDTFVWDGIDRDGGALITSPDRNAAPVGICFKGNTPATATAGNINVQATKQILEGDAGTSDERAGQALAQANLSQSQNGDGGWPTGCVGFTPAIADVMLPK